jgi:hypothetical protein
MPLLRLEDQADSQSGGLMKPLRTSEILVRPERNGLGALVVGFLLQPILSNTDPFQHPKHPMKANRLSKIVHCPPRHIVSPRKTPEREMPDL